MNECKVIVPNLDRRPDRWRWTMATLTAQGVPRNKIERFASFDGLEFLRHPDAVDRMRMVIRDQFGKMPSWLKIAREIREWSWARTWYTIMTRIMRGTEPAIVMVDDTSLSFTYDDICMHLETLGKEEYPLAAIQYKAHNTFIPNCRLTERLSLIPEMQYGFYGVGDSINLYTPLGAQKMLEFIDAPALDCDDMMLFLRRGDRKTEYTTIRHMRRGNSESVSFAFAFAGDPRGCYSTPKAQPLKSLKEDNPNYVMKGRQDRGNFRRRKWSLGEIPLPRVFDNIKYNLIFMFYDEGYLELEPMVHPEIMFRNYAYRSSFLSNEHIEERRNYGKENFAQMNGIKAKSVCEIACNDGYMLNRYAEEGMVKVVGVEPAVNLHQYISPAVHVYPDFFNHKVAHKIATEHGKFDIVHAHNVLAHTPDPVGILMGLSELMHDNSVLVLEFEYLIDMLEKVQFYHMYHEHYFYFGLGGLMEFLKCVPPLHIFKAERVEAQGGSILCALTKSEKHDDEEILKTLLKSEREYLNRQGVIDDFVENTERQLKSFVKYINAQPIDSVQGLFANAKAVVILNLALSHGLELDRFRGFYDDAEELQGNKLPGTEIEIFPTSEMSDSNEYCTVLFAPNLTELAREKYGVNTVNVEDVLEGTI